MGKQSSRESNRFFFLFSTEKSERLRLGALSELPMCCTTCFAENPFPRGWKNAHFSAFMSRRRRRLSSSKLEIPASRARDCCGQQQDNTQSWCGCDSISLHLSMLSSIDVALFTSTRSRWLNTHLGTAGKLRNVWKRLFTARQRDNPSNQQDFPFYFVDFSLCSWWVSFATTHADSSSLSENFRVISCTHRTVAAYCAVPLCQHTSHCFQVHHRGSAWRNIEKEKEWDWVESVGRGRRM